jgi:hypothetical protein
MSDDALIRKANLKALGKSATELALATGKSYQYWRDVMETPKSFGEKSARNVEEKLGLSRGSLDTAGYYSATAPKPSMSEFSKSVFSAMQHLEHIDMPAEPQVEFAPSAPDIRFSMAPDEDEQEAKDTEPPATVENLLPIETLMAGLSAYLMKMDHDARDDAGDVLRKLAAKPENHARAAAMFAAAFQQRRRKVA